MNILVTGGAGFIGSHFIESLLTTYPKDRVYNLDALTYAAHPDTVEYLQKLFPDRYAFLRGDIATVDIRSLLKEKKIDAIVNFAAESHVDRSILEPDAFVRTNVVGAENLVRQAREVGEIRFVHVSTDEVYGSLGKTDPKSIESNHLDPNSPYAASKAAADLLLLACARTYNQDISITRCTNNYGPFQFPEKLLPLLIANALENKSIPVYGDGMQVRDWIFVKDHCRGIDAVLRKGKAGEIYNISADEEKPNLEVIKTVLTLLGKPHSLITHVGDRPAHDRRYGLDATKISRELGWKPVYTFEQGIQATIDWYLRNETWWKKVRDKSYYKYYEENYAKKFAKTPEVTV